MLKQFGPIARRFSEPSSYAGLAGVLAVVAPNFPSPLAQASIYIASGVCGVIAFFLPDSTPPAAPKA